MRTTLDLPVELVEQARTAVGFKSKTDTVIFALRDVIRRKRLEELKALMSNVRFEFDPTEPRQRERRRIRARRA